LRFAGVAIAVKAKTGAGRTEETMRFVNDKQIGFKRKDTPVIAGKDDLKREEL
jgi:hypothetical protein